MLGLSNVEQQARYRPAAVPSKDVNDSEAAPTARHEAPRRRRTRAALRDEVRRLADNPADREETRVIREEMAELAPEAQD
jgi:hypothetical protein